MDMNKQAKAKTTFDNIIIYVHEPTSVYNLNRGTGRGNENGNVTDLK